MDESFNALSPAEAERLAYLMEELGESIAAAGKVLRHGYESVNPHGRSDVTNRDLLEDELCDVLTAIGQMVDEDDISRLIESYIDKKWFHHQPTRSKL